MKKRIFFLILESACRLGLGALFVYSAWTKIVNPYDFANAVRRYDLLPGFAISLFALTVPMLELLAGLAMLFTKWLRESALLVAGMLAMFIVALVQALARGLDISCGCFGLPDAGGRGELVVALARDAVLVAPAVWLMFRPNAMIEPLERMSKSWRAVCLCVAGSLLAVLFARDTLSPAAPAHGLPPETDAAAAAAEPVPSHETDAGSEPKRKETEQKQQRRGNGIDISSGPILPGEWNIDFDGVLAKAECEQRPMVLVRVSNGCAYCRQLEKSIAGKVFRLWQKDRAPLMAFVSAGSRLSPRKVVKAADGFAHGIDKNVKVPYVCVYWPQGGVTNRVAFNGRRGSMGGRKDSRLVVELMSALDNALGERLTAGRMTLESMVQAEATHISAQAEGPGGTVSMTPGDGLLAEGSKVVLSAHPGEGYAFLDWLLPDGSQAGLEANLTVHWGMPAGSYTARFKSRLQCRPPQLVSPAETTIRVKANDWFSHEIRVDESCRPVEFRIKRPVEGIAINPATGVLRGAIADVATNTLEIAVIGYDPDRTEKTVRLRIESLKRRPAARTE